MKLPTEDQIKRAASLLLDLRRQGNTRPGDVLWNMDPEQERQQLRARATDMLVIMLNQEAVFGQ
jgi:hypothetical protein